MSDENSKPDIPIGLPFVGGSDDPSDLVGLSDDELPEGAKAEEGGDPGL
jgi:hypothetical protein